MDAMPAGWKMEVGRLSSSLSFEHTQGVSVYILFLITIIDP